MTVTLYHPQNHLLLLLVLVAVVFGVVVSLIAVAVAQKHYNLSTNQTDSNKIAWSPVWLRTMLTTTLIKLMIARVPPNVLIETLSNAAESEIPIWLVAVTNNVFQKR